MSTTTVNKSRYNENSLASNLVVGLLALVFLGFGLYLTQERLQLTRSGMTAQGTVVEIKTSTTRKEGKTTTHYKPVVEFSTASGTRVRFESDTSSSTPAYQSGQRVEIIYLPNDTKTARIHDFTSLWLAPLALNIIGAFTFLLCLFRACKIWFGKKSVTDNPFIKS